jgi:transcriptional regulator with XRE-family HTH domain
VSTDTTRREQIAASLRDKEYRDAFVADHIDTGVAFQIRATREARGWSQKDLGRRAGMAQERVSVLEDPDYGKLTLTTLKRLASAFDTALVVRFVPFSQLVDWATDLAPEHLAVPDFEHDPGFERPALYLPEAHTAGSMPVPQREAVSERSLPAAGGFGYQVRQAATAWFSGYQDSEGTPLDQPVVATTR